MRRTLRIPALLVAAVLLALPASALVCEAGCARDPVAGPSAPAEGPTCHGHSDVPAAPSLQAHGASHCAHAGAIESLIAGRSTASSSFRAVAIIARAAPALHEAQDSIFASGAHAPPGAPSRPLNLPLRI